MITIPVGGSSLPTAYRATWDALCYAVAKRERLEHLPCVLARDTFGTMPAIRHVDVCPPTARLATTWRPFYRRGSHSDD
jgi:hypothetical protein